LQAFCVDVFGGTSYQHGHVCAAVLTDWGNCWAMCLWVAFIRVRYCTPLGVVVAVVVAAAVPLLLLLAALSESATTNSTIDFHLCAHTNNAITKT